MNQTNFELLLERMSDIAAAVNAFSSEAIQVQAFAALVHAFNSDFGVPAAPTSAEKHDNANLQAAIQQLDRKDGREEPEEGRARRAKRREGAAAAKIEIIKDLDLRPKDKVSFADFIAQKKPKTNEDKYVIAVYYLEQILGVAAVTESHIATVFRLTQGWREPENLPAGLRMAASRKATIDTSDRNAISTTPHGRNFVEHDLPASVEG